MTEEQRTELNALAHRFQYKKVVAYAERLELEVRLDEHETYCGMCNRHKSTCKRRKKLIDQIKEKKGVTT